MFLLLFFFFLFLLLFLLLPSSSATSPRLGPAECAERLNYNNEILIKQRLEDGWAQGFAAPRAGRVRYEQTLFFLKDLRV